MDRRIIPAPPTCLRRPDTRADARLSDPRLVPHRRRVPRHGRHRARPAFRQPVLARGAAATLGRGARPRLRRGHGAAAGRGSTPSAARSTGTAWTTGATNSGSTSRRSSTQCATRSATSTAPRSSSTCCGASASACCSRPTRIRSACGSRTRRPSCRGISTNSCRRTNSACRRNIRSSGWNLHAGTTCRSPARCSWTTARPCCRQRARRGWRGSTRCCSRTRRGRRIRPVDGIAGRAQAGRPARFRPGSAVGRRGAGITAALRRAGAFALRAARTSASTATATLARGAPLSPSPAPAWERLPG